MADELAHSRAEDLACNAAVELMTEYLEGALVLTEARRLELHLETCPGCSEYLEQLRSVAGALRGFATESIPPDVRADLIDAFRGFRKG
jgi:anti-sigma factor RsiW